MKKVLLAIAIVALAAAGAYAATPSQTTAGPNTSLYHSYDGLVCSDCHTLHNSEDGAAATMGGGGPYSNLLQKADVTDICLSCHKQGFNTAANADLNNDKSASWTAPIVMTLDGIDPAGVSMPAGDFWDSWNDPKKGHNPAYSHGTGTVTSLMMSVDSTLGFTPPGGAALTDEWSCHSCHGMHNRFSNTYSAWRQIKRKVNGIVHTGCDTEGTVETAGVCDPAVGSTATGYEAIKSNSRGDIQVTSYVDARADGNPLEGADLYADESDTNKNVYRGGFSSFCSTCHGDFHGGNDSSKAGQNINVRENGHWLRHPTNLSLSDPNIKSKYGIAGYTKVVSNVQGNNPNPVGYDWKYPLIQPDLNFTVSVSGLAKDVSGTVVADVRLSCLTCHKAHASKFENMTRWDTNGHAFIQANQVDAWGETSTGDNPVYGCGKCHQKGGAKAFVKSF